MTPTTDAPRQNLSGLCRICNTPRCTAVCPKAVKKAVLKILLAAALVHMDATAGPADAQRDNLLGCERGVIYVAPP